MESSAIRGGKGFSKLTIVIKYNELTCITAEALGVFMSTCSSRHRAVALVSLGPEHAHGSTIPRHAGTAPAAAAASSHSSSVSPLAASPPAPSQPRLSQPREGNREGPRRGHVGAPPWPQRADGPRERGHPSRSGNSWRPFLVKFF